MNLNQVTVPCTDLSESISFYQKLGLKLIVHSTDHYARFECPDGSSTFSLHVVEQKGKGEAPYVYFECKNLDESVENLLKEGIKFDHLPQDQSWLWREARLKDPYGNQLVLYYAGENRLYPPWRLEEEIKK
ncbi:MAG: VOC family protein [Bacteroidota bacterium]